MTKNLVGVSIERTAIVSPDLAIDFLGHDGTRVLATPNLIWGLEFAARDAILPFLKPGHDSVGTQVNIAHLAPTPIGMQVRFRAEVTSVDGQRVTYSVHAYDEVEKIAEGTHQRFVVDISRFATEVTAKAAKAKREGRRKDKNRQKSNPGHPRG